MTNQDISDVCALEEVCLAIPQVAIETIHAFWAGCYVRTIKVPKNTLITGALIKIPTILIISGDIEIAGIGRVIGYQIAKGAPNRKCAFLAHEDTYLTMVFATDKTTVEEAEQDFTDEVDKLGSRR